MIAQLKALELQGYKTFANRTRFEFSDRVTVIVGPNGSGKSNIADSIRWVLGEQSYRLLRGKKTEDMIFAGSEKRARSGYAYVTITFDNSDGWLPIDFTEVAITRRAYRDGQNEYLINGNRMRLKDVSELLAQSGLAERTYTIIGQGLVDAALALKADERRRLFEEAAGIGLYRSRREEAIRRLDITLRNVERVQDITHELRPSLKSLERQAKKSHEFGQLKDDLQGVLLEWYGYHWHRAQERLSTAIDNANDHENELTRARTEQEETGEKLEKLQERIITLRNDLNLWHSKSSGFHSKKEVFSRELAVIDERIYSLNNQNQNARIEHNKLSEDELFQKERLSIAINDIKQHNAALIEAQTLLDESIQKLDSILSERSKAEQAYQEVRQKGMELIEREGELRIRLDEKDLQLERDRETLFTSEKSIIELETAQSLSTKHLQTLEKQLNEAANNQQNAELTYQEYLEKINNFEDNIRSDERQKSIISSEMNGVQAQIGVLNQAEKNLVGYTQGTQLLINAARDSRLDGILGALNTHLEIPAEYEIAIAAALGEYINAVIVESDPDDALDMLVGQMKRGVLLPLHSIRFQEDIGNIKEIQNDGIIGLASDLVIIKSKIGDIVQLLLGNVIVVRSRGVAREIMQQISQKAYGKNPANNRIVTLDGEVYYFGGPILTTGSKSNSNDQTLLSRNRNHKEMRNRLKGLKQEINRLKDNIQRSTQELVKIRDGNEQINITRRNTQGRFDKLVKENDKARNEEQQLLKQLEWQKQQRDKLNDLIEGSKTEIERVSTQLIGIKEQKEENIKEQNEKRHILSGITCDENQMQVNHWKTAVALAKQAILDSEKRKEELNESYLQTNLRVSELRERVAQFGEKISSLELERAEKRQEEETLDKDSEEFDKMIIPAEGELNNLEHEQIGYQNIDLKSRHALSLVEHSYAQAKIELARQEEALESLRRRMEDDLGLVSFEYADQITGPTPLPFEGIVEKLPVTAELPEEVEETIKQKRAQLRRIGPVNPEAEKEFKELNERYTFLSDQVSDLEKAEADVRKVISELDELMERDLLHTFNLVSTEFKEVFSRLFNGGSARLLLTDPDDMTNTGIDIEARLPGRRMQGLSLLSGGERSLTATALIFSLLKVAPTPFCLLDEVDAMLDEANIVRFRELLQELSEHTQFVVVTHNRNTVQAADVIYGVTMGRDSTSHVVSLKPDEVVKEFAE